jgi:hypothetical protein
MFQSAKHPNRLSFRESYSNEINFAYKSLLPSDMDVRSITGIMRMFIQENKSDICRESLKGEGVSAWGGDIPTISNSEISSK